MQILENRDAWSDRFKSGWLARYNATGQPDWQKYPRPRNKELPVSPGIALRDSRLLLISSAGGYLRNQQEPFDAANLLGDYTIRIFPAATPFDALDFAHDHYDHADRIADPQTVLPLRHLEDLVSEGQIGELAPSVISFMGYQPDITRVVDELIPSVLEIARNEQVQAALLVPV